MCSHVKWVFVCFLSIVLLLTACSAAPVSEKSESGSFYPVHETQAVKYSYPNRPYDADVMLEGYGWQAGKFYVVLNSKDIIGDIYSSVSKRLAPRVMVDGKAVTLTEFLWEEGAREAYKGSMYRYACTVKKAEAIPEGTIPDEIRIDNANFVIGKTLPAVEKPPSPVYLAERDADVRQSAVTLGDQTYAPTRLLVTPDKQELKLTVTSKQAAKESRNRRFLLIDDKNRLYTFAQASLPESYTAGDNTISMLINERMPEDVTQLQLIIFDVELIQSDLYSVQAEHKVRVL